MPEHPGPAAGTAPRPSDQRPPRSVMPEAGTVTAIPASTADATAPGAVEPPAAGAAEHRAGGTWLAFDFGTRRTGVAVGEAILGAGRPLPAVVASDRGLRHVAIDRLVRDWQPVGLVVGLPLAESGGEQEHSRRCRQFARDLARRHGLPVILVDERYTSWEADQELRGLGLGRRARAAGEDSAAAAEILRVHLQSLSERCRP